jgi:hypothetical protein
MQASASFLGFADQLETLRGELRSADVVGVALRQFPQQFILVNIGNAPPIRDHLKLLARPPKADVVALISSGHGYLDPSARALVATDLKGPLLTPESEVMASRDDILRLDHLGSYAGEMRHACLPGVLGHRPLRGLVQAVACAIRSLY